MAKRKFEIGDTVKVAKRVPNYRRSWVGGMDRSIGRVLMVIAVDGIHCRCSNGFEYPSSALKLVKKTTVVTLKINSNYTAIIDAKTRTVKVDCQTFTFAKIKELASKL